MVKRKKLIQDEAKKPIGKCKNVQNVEDISFGMLCVFKLIIHATPVNVRFFPTMFAAIWSPDGFTNPSKNCSQIRGNSVRYHFGLWSFEKPILVRGLHFKGPPCVLGVYDRSDGRADKPEFWRPMCLPNFYKVRGSAINLVWLASESD